MSFSNRIWCRTPLNLSHTFPFNLLLLNLIILISENKILNVMMMCDGSALVWLGHKSLSKAESFIKIVLKLENVGLIRQ